MTSATTTGMTTGTTTGTTSQAGTGRATDWRARVLDEVEGSAADLVRFLADLVRTPSEGGSDAENTAQHDLARRLEHTGLEVDHWQVPLAQTLAAADFPGAEVARAEAWGLVGRLPGRAGSGATNPGATNPRATNPRATDPGTRTLMLNGHIDVVPPGEPSTWSEADPYSGRVDGDRLYGRGSCDMKAGLVAAVWALQALAQARVPLAGDVLLASVQGEEDGGLGSYDLLRRGWRADACVIPEPTGLDLVPASAGSLTFRLRVPGLATHASRRTAGVSAIDNLWPLTQALADLERRRNADVDPLFERWELAYPISIGVVHSGQWASSVPDLLVAEGRLGVALGESVEYARAALEEAVAQACDRSPFLRDHPVGVEWWGGQFASGQLAAGSDLLDRVGAAHRSAGGTPQATWGAPYGSDLRLLTGIGGIPTVHYGPGDVTLAHGPDEWVPISQTRQCARTLAVLAIDVCGLRD